MLRGLGAAWVISLHRGQGCQGPCRLAFCEGLIESRERGRLGGVVDARQRTCGVDDMGESVMGFGWPIRTPRVHVPAFPDSYLPGVNSITKSRTQYL